MQQTSQVWKRLLIFTNLKEALCRDSYFGFDPLSQRPDLVLRRDEMMKRANPSFSDIFIAGDGMYFENIILFCISVTNHLSSLF